MEREHTLEMPGFLGSRSILDYGFNSCFETVRYQMALVYICGNGRACGDHRLDHELQCRVMKDG